MSDHITKTPHRSVYISGPMTGFPDFNFPAFNAAAERWRHAGWDVINPAEEFEGRTDLEREVYLRRDIENLLRVDGLALLPGWADSKGARLELAIAQELGLSIFNAETMGPAFLPDMVVAPGPYPGLVFVEPCKSVLNKDPQPAADKGNTPQDLSVSHEAHDLVYGDRNKAYGHPHQDYVRTSRLWEAMLGMEPGTIGPYRAALMMTLMKVSRAAYQYRRDTLVDVCGYAECAHRIHRKEAGEPNS